MRRRSSFARGRVALRVRRTAVTLTTPLNNLIEQDHRGVKQRIATMLGFKGFATAAITIAGIELMHRIRKGQFGLGRLGVQGRLALQCGMPCSKLEVSTAQHGTLSGAGYLHQSPLRKQSNIGAA